MPIRTRITSKGVIQEYVTGQRAAPSLQVEVQASDVSGNAMPEVDVFVYRAGASDAGNVFGIWRAAHEARRRYAGPARIIIDDSLGSCTVPSGSWNMADTVLSGRVYDRATVPPLAAITVNGQLPNLSLVEDIRISCDAGAGVPIVPFVSEQQALYAKNATITGVSSPLLLSPGAPSTTDVNVYLDRASLTNGGSCVLSGSNYVWVDVHMHDNSTVGANSVAGELVTFSAKLYDASCSTGSLSGLMSATQTLYQRAAAVSFSAAGNMWAASTPNDVGSAVNRLAAADVQHDFLLPAACLPTSGSSVHAAVPGGSPLSLTSGFAIPVPARDVIVCRGAGGPNPVTYYLTYVDLRGVVTSSQVQVAPLGSGSLRVAVPAENIMQMYGDQDAVGTTTLVTGESFSVGKYVLSGTSTVWVNGVQSSCTVDPATGTVTPLLPPNGSRTYALRLGIAAFDREV